MVMANTSSTKAGHRTDRVHSTAMRTLRRQAVAIKDDARDLAETAGTVAAQQLDPIRNYVNAKPLQALVIAGGVGLMLGFLFSFSRR
jgi:ElaB/YqjD/DUF883 family membrane-anchored ribosome-binding protein